jgi:hypothetical protein
MRHALIAAVQRVDLEAAAPPRDRTSRTTKALELCKAEWSRAYEVGIEKGQPAAKALRMAQVAYKLAMPKMESLPSIRAYIAAIAQGIQLEVFGGRDGSQLLYAAQVALATLKQKGAKKQ